MLIYRAYAQMMISNSGFAGPTTKNLTFQISSIEKDSGGTLVFDRFTQVTIPDAWTDIMLAANHYFWPNGELIRDYFITLVNAISLWGLEAADKNSEGVRN